MDDGRIIPVGIEFTAGFEEGVRQIVPTVTLGSPVQLAQTNEHITRLAYQPTEGGSLVSATGTASNGVDAHHRRPWSVRAATSEPPSVG